MSLGGCRYPGDAAGVGDAAGIRGCCRCAGDRDAAGPRGCCRCRGAAAACSKPPVRSARGMLPVPRGCCWDPGNAPGARGCRRCPGNAPGAQRSGTGTVPGRFPVPHRAPVPGRAAGPGPVPPLRGRQQPGRGRIRASSRARGRSPGAGGGRGRGARVGAAPLRAAPGGPGGTGRLQLARRAQGSPRAAPVLPLTGTFCWIFLFFIIIIFVLIFFPVSREKLCNFPSVPESCRRCCRVSFCFFNSGSRAP